MKSIELKEENMEMKFSIEEMKIRMEEQQKYRNHPFMNVNQQKTSIDTCSLM